MAKFAGHVAALRSSPTVFADIPASGSTSTRVLSGSPPRASSSPAMLFGLYRIGFLPGIICAPGGRPKVGSCLTDATPGDRAPRAVRLFSDTVLAERTRNDYRGPLSRWNHFRNSVKRGDGNSERMNGLVKRIALRPSRPPNFVVS
jgi:hypothetical protein